jgi:hypothetical protein
MSFYAIDTFQHRDGECAFCGSMDDLVRMHIHNANNGGKTWIPGCRSCNASMGSQTLKKWLRSLKYESHWKWYDILEWQRWKRTKLAELIREVRDEWP